MSLLEDARKRINEVDKEIARLFEKRMQAVEDVARYKQEHALPVLDQSREQEVLDRNVNYIENEKYKDSYLSMMKDMMRISRNYQQSLLHKEVVGYQGVEGAFSSIAAKHLFPHYKKRSYTSFEDVIKHPQYQWFLGQLANYGFIIRYPENKDTLTGYSYESWHLRYLGKDLAKKVTASNLTYDEYYAQNYAK